MSWWNGTGDSDLITILTFLLESSGPSSLALAAESVMEFCHSEKTGPLSRVEMEKEKKAGILILKTFLKVQCTS